MGDMITISGILPHWKYYVLLLLAWGINVPLWTYGITSFWDYFIGGLVIIHAIFVTVSTKPVHPGKYSKKNPGKLIKAKYGYIGDNVRYYRDGELIDYSYSQEDD